MKPLINLKSFLAVLLILIVPAALLVAYFRNYSSEAPAHEHSEKGKGDGSSMKMDGDMSGMKSGDDSHAAMGHGNTAKDGDKGATKSSGDSHSEMDHEKMPKDGDKVAAKSSGDKMAAMDHSKMAKDGDKGGAKPGGGKMAAMDHEKMAMPKDGKMQSSEPAKKKAPMPDTLEGVWKAIHEHHAELKTSVEAKKFKEVQSHAAMMSELTEQLVVLSHPDHKPAVESGVKKITQALDELKSSAETGSETVMPTSFKVFEDALNELEQQMKKQ